MSTRRKTLGKRHSQLKKDNSEDLANHRPITVSIKGTS